MEENKKPTYEELEQLVQIKNNQLAQMYQQLEVANTQNIFMRLDLLFKVLEFSGHFNTAFAEECAKEIQSLLEIPKEEVKEEE